MAASAMEVVRGLAWADKCRPPSSCAAFLPAVKASSAPNLQLHSTTLTQTQKTVLIPIAFGIEEIEAVVMVDILRRAGADVLVASVEESLHVEGARRVKLVADEHILSCDGKQFDLIALPGGMPGSARLQECELLKQMTMEQVGDEKLVGAVSTSPAVTLQGWGILQARKATCHPGFADKMSPTFTTKAKVQTDGCVTTSQGPGTAFDFALSFVERLYGKEKHKEVSKPLVLGTSTRQEFNHWSWKAIRTPQVLVPIASGSEEMEAVVIVNVLRRAGMSVVMASVEPDLQVEASRKVKLVADKRIQDVEKLRFDLIVLPGGMPGAERLRDCISLQEILMRQMEEKRPLGAICAAPAIILEANGWLKGKKATCHPAFVNKLSNKRVAKTRVVIDGHIITSRGPGTALEFGLCIVEKFFGKERASNVAKALVFESP